MTETSEITRPKLKVIEVLILIFMVFATVNRIDLADGKLNFVLSPAVLFALVSCLYAGSRLVVSRNLGAPIKDFLIIIALLLGWSAFTLYNMQEAIQARRLALFGIVVISSFGCYLVLFRSKHRRRLISLFVGWSFLVYCLFSVVQVILFVYQQLTWVYDEPLPYFRLLHQLYGATMVRINGGFVDANLAGYFLITIYILIKKYKLHQAFILPIIVLVFFTLSRSSIGVLLLVMALEWIVARITGNGIRISQRQIAWSLLSIAIVAVALTIIGFSTDYFVRMGDALIARFQDKDGSGSIHFTLIGLATQIYLSSLGNIVHGLGFASSSHFAEILFPDDKYANFHSDFLTILFEIGVVGLVIYLLLYAVPVINAFKKPLKDVSYGMILILALAAENIFYQQYLLFHYWVAIVFVWTMIRKMPPSDA